MTWIIRLTCNKIVSGRAYAWYKSGGRYTSHLVDGEGARPAEGVEREMGYLILGSWKKGLILNSCSIRGITGGSGSKG